jgi:integrase
VSRGHLTRHGDDAWRIFVNVGTDPVTGRRRRVTKVVHGNRKDAERALTQLLSGVDGGAHGGEGDTFGHVVDAFLAHKALSVEATTLDTYRASLAYVTDHLRALPAAKIGVTHLEQLYAHLITNGRRKARADGSRGLGPAAVGNVHAAIHNAFELARRRGPSRATPAPDPRPRRRRRPAPQRSGHGPPAAPAVRPGLDLRRYPPLRDARAALVRR